MKNKVIITGYPKSGNTWLTRLIAEALDSPVIGFYNEPDNEEEAIEGLERNGLFEVFKSHSPPPLIRRKEPNAHIISIVRDPRETYASSIRFFNLSRHHAKRRFNQHLPFRTFYKILDHVTNGKKNQRRRLRNAFLFGDWKVHPHLGISWNEFYSFSKQKNNETAIIRYESLSEKPEKTLQTLFDSLGIEVSKPLLEKAIFNQSFSRKKNELQKLNLPRKANFLKSGKTDSWRESITTNEADTLWGNCSVIAESLGYKDH